MTLYEKSEGCQCGAAMTVEGPDEHSVVLWCESFRRRHRNCAPLKPLAHGKIRIHYSPDGTLPPNIVTRPGVTRFSGWYAITPNGVAHHCHNGSFALTLVRSWLRNFARDADFWFNLTRD